MYNVCVNGFVGNYGTKVLIENKFDELANYFNVYFLKKVLNDIEGGCNPSLFWENDKNNIVDRIDITKGGILTALWKICARNNFGIRFSLLDVPILQGTIEISNYFDINPYRLLTNNAEILILDEEDESIGEVNAAKTYKKIGFITKGKKRIKIDNDIESFLTKDYKDEIEKALPGYIKKI